MIIRIQDLTGSGSNPNRFAGVAEPRHEVKHGDLLISWAATLGVFWWKGEDAVLNQHIFKVESFVDKRFHYYLAGHVITDLYRQAHGSGMVHITKSRFEGTPVLVPPIAEQRRIVIAIEEHLSRLDSGVAGFARVHQLIQGYRSAVLNAACAGTLTEESRSGSEHTSPLRSTTELLQPIPAGWAWRPALDVCTSVDSGGTPAADDMSQGVGDVPFIKVYNLSMTGRLGFDIRPTFIPRRVHEGRLRRSRIRPNDVLTNIVGPPLGKVALVPGDHPEWNTNQAVVVFRPGPDLLPKYLLYALMSPSVIGRLKATGRATAGQFNVSVTACRSLLLPIPPLEAQARIVGLVDQMLSVTDAVAEALHAQTKLAADLRSRILSQALLGRLVRQDPQDEPARVLLDRTHARALDGLLRSHRARSRR
jgi:type I restriction enzyme S subunit